jgi:ArsR family transcriptional regulator
MPSRSAKLAAQSGALRSSQEYRAGADVFKALGHSSRLLIVDVLTHGERCVADLTQLIGCDTSTVSNHLSVLRNVGIVADERRGQQVFYRIATPCVRKVFACLEEMRAARE